MVTKKLAKLILKKYYTLSFPASYMGVKPFQKSLKDNLDINISQDALRRLLKSSVHYQTNFMKKGKFQKRKLYSAGLGVECYSDTIFIPLEGGKRFIFLACVDNHSRYLYSTALKGLSRADIKKWVFENLKTIPRMVHN